MTDDMIDAAVRAYNAADSTRHGLRAALTAALAAQPVGYPECSGDPASCPENEGFGCCQETPQPQPQRVPLTQHEAYAGFSQDSHGSFADFLGGIRFAERAHGITLADTGDST